MTKQITLTKTKEKYIGRVDSQFFVDPIEKSNDDTSYDLFAEADEEEVDPPKFGQSVTGTVIEMDDSGALVEIGGKISGFIPIKEASLAPIKHVNEVLELGQEVTGEMVGTLKGMPVISFRASQMIKAWDVVLKVRAADETFESEILETNKGGVVCSAFGLRAFLPGSHLSGPVDKATIGAKIMVKFLDVIEEEGKIVVSQKRATSDGITQLQRGAVVKGVVTGLRPYGAFLELENGAAGLLHISQISYDRIDNVEKILTVGLECKVMIIDHDKLTGRVALSTKTLEPNPGDMLRDMSAVFSKAEETAQRYHERAEAERSAREAAAKDIVAGVGITTGTTSSDPLASVAESIESILASIVADSPPAV